MEIQSNNDTDIAQAIRNMLATEANATTRALLLIMQQIGSSLEETSRLNKQLEKSLLDITLSGRQKKGFISGLKQALPIIALLLCGYQAIGLREYNRIIGDAESINKKINVVEHNISLIIANSSRKVRDGIAFDRVVNNGDDNEK